MLPIRALLRDWPPPRGSRGRTARLPRAGQGAQPVRGAVGSSASCAGHCPRLGAGAAAVRRQRPLQQDPGRGRAIAGMACPAAAAVLFDAEGEAALTTEAQTSAAVSDPLWSSPPTSQSSISSSSSSPSKGLPDTAPVPWCGRSARAIAESLKTFQPPQPLRSW